MKTNPYITNKFFVLACLYTAQTLPGHFAVNAMPIIMRREGFSLESIGVVGLVGLPWALKILWAPMVDRYGGKNNHYRKWVFSMQALFALLTLSAALFSLRQDLGIVVALMTLSFAFAATQDIAVDAYAVKMLHPGERGLGNGIQTGGNMLGVFLGSSAALAFYFYTSWASTLVAISATVLIMGLPLVFAGERPGLANKKASYGDIISFFRIPGAAPWIPIILLAFGGIFSAMTMCKPLLVDKGFDWYFIALAMGVFPVAGIPTALMTGLAIKKWGLKKVFVVCCLAGFFSCAALIPVSMGQGGAVLVCASLAGIFGVFAVLMTVLNTIAMGFARQGREGADFTMFTSLAFLGGMSFVGLSGVVAQSFGYVILFSACAGLCLLVCALFLLLFGSKSTAIDMLVHGAEANAGEDAALLLDKSGSS